MEISAPRHSLRSPRMERRLVVGIGGMLTSLAMHVLLIQAVIWGSGASISSPRMREGLGANAFGAPEEAIATLFFVEDSSVATPDEDDTLDELASAGKVLQSLRVTVVSMDASIDSALHEHESEKAAEATEEQSAGERQARAALFGRYMGQIHARIERAWQRPRAPSGADTFECQVQVLQNARGEVQEVVLRECDGSPQWQLSLVRAIERVSPLPAPPDPAVFSNSILLSFEARDYGPGSEPELYEPESRTSVAAALSRTTYSSEGQ